MTLAPLPAAPDSIRASGPARAPEAAPLVPKPARTWPVGVLLFAFLYLAALLVYSGRFAAIDEAVLFGMTRSLVTEGSFAADAFRWANRTEIVVLGENGPGGRLYTYFEPAQAVLAAPLYWVGLLPPAGGLLEAVLLLNPLVFAATGVVLWQIGRALGYRLGVALAGALIITLATPFWPYSKTFFREPLAALAILVSVLCLVRLRRGSAWWALAAGLAFGAGLLTRTSNILAAPACGLLLLAALIPATEWRRRILLTGAFAGGVLVGVVLLLAYTGIRFGDPFYSPYQAQYFGSSLLTGVWGLLLSPGKGILLYAPILIAALIALPRFVRRDIWLGLAVIVTAVAFVAFFARYVFWWGGFAWGPRFLMAALPLVALPLFAAIDWTWQARQWWPKAVLGALAGASVLVQINAVAVRHGDYLYWLGQTRGETQPETGSLLTDFAASPVVAQWTWLSPVHSDLVWWRLADGRSILDTPVLAVILLGLVLAGFGLARTAMARYRLSAVTIVLAALVGAVVLGSATALTLVSARQARAASELAWTAAEIRAGAGPNDRVITGLGHRTAEFLNEFDRNLPVAGLPLEGYPPDPAVQSVLTDTAAEAGRVWLISDGVTDADPRNGVGRWLAENAYPLARRAHSGVQAGAYATVPPERLTDLAGPTPADFAGELRLAGVRANSAGWQAGGSAAIETTWQVLDRPATPYRLTAALVDPNGRVLSQNNHEPHDGFLPLTDQSPGDRFTDRIGVRIPDDAPAGVYWLALGVLDPVAGRMLPLDAAGTTEARFGPYRIAPAAGSPPPELNRPVAARVGDALVLQGANVPAGPFAPGDEVPVTLAWRAEAPVGEPYQVFLHLGRPGSPPVAQSDGVPADGRYPTDFWQPGEIVTDQRILRVPPDTPPGIYDLFAGMYRLPDGARLPASVAGRPVDAVPLGQVEVR